MAEEITISTFMSLLAHEEMEHMADYVRRKRPLSAVPLEQLRHDWVRLFRVFMREHGEINIELEDVEAEIKLRGADLPRDEIRDEAKYFCERSLARAWAMPREDKARINAALERDLQRYLEIRGARQ
jgi:hypothetical protein